MSAKPTVFWRLPPSSVGAVHPLADVVGDLLVEVLLERGELVGHGLGDPLGEQRLALEREQVLLDHAAHEPDGVGGVTSSRYLPSNRSRSSSVRKSWKSSSLPRVRGRGHQQRWRVTLAEQLAELEALGLLELAAEVVGAHPVRLVDDDEVPLGLGELGLQLLVAGELVHPGDQQRVRARTTTGVDVRRRSSCGREEVEPQPELEEQLVLPLLDQAAGRDDQAPLDVVAEQQLLDVEPGHDRLAGAGVVGEQEAQRRARQQLAVDRADLVRQRLRRRWSRPRASGRTGRRA